MNYSEGTRTLGRGPPLQQGPPGGRFGGPGPAGPGLGQRGFSDPGMPPFASMGGPPLGGPPMGGPRPFVSSTCKYSLSSYFVGLSFSRNFCNADTTMSIRFDCSFVSSVEQQ